LWIGSISSLRIARIALIVAHMLPQPTHRPRSLDWQTRAACRDKDPELFFPLAVNTGRDERDQRIAAAKTVCRHCPVAESCLNWAVDMGDVDAILGGTTPAERETWVKETHRRRGLADAAEVAAEVTLTPAEHRAITSADQRGYIAGHAATVRAALVASGLCIHRGSRAVRGPRTGIRLTPAGRAYIALHTSSEQTGHALTGGPR